MDGSAPALRSAQTPESAPAATEAAPPEGHPDPLRGWILAACCIVGFARMADPKLWQMGLDIPATAFGAGWQEYRVFSTVTGLLLVAAMLVGGLLGDYFGRRRVLLSAMLVATVAGVLTAAAPGVPWFVATRSVDVAAGAVAFPLTLAVVRLTFTGRERPLALLVYTDDHGRRAAGGAAGDRDRGGRGVAGDARAADRRRGGRELPDLAPRPREPRPGGRPAAGGHRRGLGPGPAAADARRRRGPPAGDVGQPGGADRPGPERGGARPPGAGLAGADAAAPGGGPGPPPAAPAVGDAAGPGAAQLRADRVRPAALRLLQRGAALRLHHRRAGAAAAAGGRRPGGAAGHALGAPAGRPPPDRRGPGPDGRLPAGDGAAPPGHALLAAGAAPGPVRGRLSSWPRRRG